MSRHLVPGPVPRALFLFTQDDEEINKKTRGGFSLASWPGPARQMLLLLDHFSTLPRVITRIVPYLLPRIHVFFIDDKLYNNVRIRELVELGRNYKRYSIKDRLLRDEQYHITLMYARVCEQETTCFPYIKSFIIKFFSI